MEAMSSFRIDRQHVSFVTAETKAVFHPQEAETLRRGPDDAGGAGRTEAERQRAQILSRARQEAEETAAAILERAGTKAAALVEEAERKAGEIVRAAQDGAVAVLEEAKRAGYTEGLENARAEAEARKAAEAEELAQIQEGLYASYTQLLDGMRGDVISLVMDITKKVIGVRLEETDEVFLGLVGSALEQLKQSGTAVIHVGSADYARCFGAAAEKRLGGGRTKLVVTEEEDYSSGDLVVETEGEMLDLGIDGQLKRIETAFLEEGE